MIKGNCLYCSKEFITDGRSHRKYCDYRCKQSHYYRTKKKYHERITRTNNLYKKRNKKKIAEYMTRYQRERHIIDPEYRKKKAVRDATRQKYEKSGFCEECGQERETHFHHPKPYRVDVFKEYCVPCHKEEHREVPIPVRGEI